MTMQFSYGIVTSRNTSQIKDLVYFGEHCNIPASHNALRGDVIINTKTACSVSKEIEI